MTPVTDHTGATFRSTHAMCQAWGISQALYTLRRQHGMSQERALTQAARAFGRRGRSVQDHTGRDFPSIRAMARAWGVGVSTYRFRVAAGWSLERALTAPATKNRPRRRGVSRDHLGHEFATFRAMCEAWHVRESRTRGRLDAGWSLERALTTPNSRGAGGMPARDHTGRDFPSLSAMARAWGLSFDTVSQRLDAGWSLEQALTTPVGVTAGGKKCTDHTGRTFASVHGMAMAWGVPLGILYNRLEAGWDVERALTTPAGAPTGWDKRKCTDHTGRTFPSVFAMCEAWGVPHARYVARIKRRWTVARALTAPPRHGRRDHTGREFQNVREMCRAWGVPYDRYAARRRFGWSLEQALTAPSIQRECRRRGVTYGDYRRRRHRGASVEEALEANG